MLSFYLKCRKNTGSKNPAMGKGNKGNEVHNSTILRFIKKQEESRLLNTFGLKTPLCKVPLLGDIFLQRYKMNKKESKVFKR